MLSSQELKLPFLVVSRGLKILREEVCEIFCETPLETKEIKLTKGWHDSEPTFDNSQDLMLYQQV